ncbi:MAG: hypothetical protein ACM3UO_00625 [Bacillota bacterium]
MTKDEFAQVRAQRPDPLPPTDEVVRRAKERLMQSITEEQITDTVVTDVPRPDWRRRVRISLAAASVAAVAAVGVTVAVGGHGSGTSTQISATATPQQALETAARLVAYTVPTPGTIRHIRFRNETDPGNPTYDRYIRPDGSAMVGTAGGRLEASGGYLPSAELAALPSDPTALRAAMMPLAAKHGYATPGQAPERALFRLAIDLLTDPGVAADVKAGVYRVIEHFNLPAISAKNLGATKDVAGRPGIGLEFHFEEDADEVVVLDPKTGAVLSDTITLTGGQPFAGQTYLNEENVTTIPHTAP